MTCGCSCGRETPAGHEYIHGHNKRKRPFEAVYNSFIHTSERDGKPNTLTYEEFVAFANIPECHYCGAEIVWRMYTYFRGKHQLRYNLDRKDNAVGYTKENCVVCCKRCNQAKLNHFTYDEWVKIGNVIKEFTT
jgi:hypothetical protein